MRFANPAAAVAALLLTAVAFQQLVIVSPALAAVRVTLA